MPGDFFLSTGIPTSYIYIRYDLIHYRRRISSTCYLYKKGVVFTKAIPVCSFGDCGI